MTGSGCKNCPVRPCETMNYRGSACAEQRAKFGLGDPQTNADRIRKMSDEELSEMIADNILTGACNDFDIPGKNPCPHNCKKCVLEWLRMPHEEEK